MKTSHFNVLLKTIYFTLISILLISCRTDESTNNSSSTLYRWSFKINGVKYEWSGHVGDGTGGAMYLKDNVNYSDGDPNGSVSLLNEGALQTSNSNNLLFSFQLPKVAQGTFVLNNNNYPNNFAVLITRFGGPTNSKTYLVDNTHIMTITITELSESTAKGTFSGTLRNMNDGSTISITEGTFVAGRLL